MYLFAFQLAWGEIIVVESIVVVIIIIIVIINKLLAINLIQLQLEG